MIRITTVLFLLVLTLGLASAQTQSQFLEGQEFTLMPIPQNIQKAMMSDGKGLMCGPYFNMASKDKRPNADGKYTVTTFEFMKDNNPSYQIMGVDKLVVIVDSKKITPTVAYAKRWGFNNTVPFHWIIRISEKDLKTAQACIPDPTSKK